jgi:hypothetical protein
MGQVLSILGLSTKEMTRGRISECDWLDVFLMANYGTETFLNRLVGRTDIEDALERLDMLTKEEIGMTVARNLAVTHVVDGNVKVVEGVTRGIDDHVKVVEDVARAIDDNVKIVEDVTRGIDDNVKVVEETVRTIKDGTLSLLNFFMCLDQFSAYFRNR